MKRNHLIGAICAGGVVFMTGAAFAAVPLYKMFCQVTGFDGTVRRAEAAPAAEDVLDRQITVRFDTNVRDLPMRFRAEQTLQKVRIGETGMAYFDVTNTSDKPIQARAAYNVVPESTGPYFQKLQCFCFETQTIQPELATDRETRGASEITLSYTFYPARDGAPTATSSGLIAPARSG